ncbi:GATA zinc finger protein [Colletotrichum truncatum]|uniref:GATA zinc finger protein n=1 Tax=Colletotrichum truncatum TaxID=5467 RepID=A0ACC3ZEJ7_COLTU|nr:GATA zinc finger protein [Colletotrichum truncatum]KAF6794902.1 GATA zinc finger protein [Colletotrichum truncatum]
MEAGGSGTRQSRPPSASKPDRFETQLPPREPLNRHYRDGPAMATAALISPSTTPYGHPTSFSSGYQHAAPGPSIAGMISPVEPRRPSDESETPHRQSLPSLSEVISGAKPSAYPPSQASSMSGSQSFPSPFAPGPPRSYAESSTDKNSPRPLHLASTYPPRPEALPAISDAPRPPPFAGRPPAPMSSFPGPQPSPPHKPEHMRDPDTRAPEPTGPYTHHHAPPPPPPPTIYPHPHPSQLPPGQVPLPAYPVSPRHGGPPLPSPYDAQRPGVHAEDSEYGPARAQYDRTLNRHLDAWGYQDCLSRVSGPMSDAMSVKLTNKFSQIAGATRTIYNFAEAYGRIAAEQHGAHPLPDRLPTEREVNDMLDNVEYIRNSLDSVRQLVKESNERARAAGKQKGYEDEDTPMYDGMNKNSYGITEVKKRRGRAAPPGRCHSCNRIDTPEWRRGPDGARTLCNACGLHYAKLERKRQLEARQIRPKPSDERS